MDNSKRYKDEGYSSLFSLLYSRWFIFYAGLKVPQRKQRILIHDKTAQSYKYHLKAEALRLDCFVKGVYERVKWSEKQTEIRNEGWSTPGVEANICQTILWLLFANSKTNELFFFPQRILCYGK